MMSSPIYLEFLSGKRELTCTAWGNPTRNVKGWKGPCYLITDEHHDTLPRPDGQHRLGRTTATARTRAASTAWCTAATSRRRRWASTRKLGDSLKMLMWQMSADAADPVRPATARRSLVPPAAPACVRSRGRRPQQRLPGHRCRADRGPAALTVAGAGDRAWAPSRRSAPALALDVACSATCRIGRGSCRRRASAGACVRSLRVGDLVLATEVVRRRGPSLAGDLAGACRRRMAAARAARPRLLTAPAPRSATPARSGGSGTRRTARLAVDMESATVARRLRTSGRRRSPACASSPTTWTRRCSPRLAAHRCDGERVRRRGCWPAVLRRPALLVELLAARRGSSRTPLRRTGASDLDALLRPSGRVAGAVAAAPVGWTQRTTERLRPRRLASRRAAAASCVHLVVVGGHADFGDGEAEADTVMRIGWPVVDDRRRSTVERMRSARTTAPSSSVSRAMTRNSSPPIRPTESTSRSEPVRMRARPLSTSSPPVSRYSVLTCLKWSTSMMPRQRAGIAGVALQLEAGQLVHGPAVDRPVSGSVRASRSSSRVRCCEQVVGLLQLAGPLGDALLQVAVERPAARPSSCSRLAFEEELLGGVAEDLRAGPRSARA